MPFSEPVTEAGRRVMREANDWDQAARSGPTTTLGDLHAAIGPKEIEPVVVSIERTDDIRKSTNLTDRMFLLGKIDSPEEARQMSLAARALKDQTTGALELVGKGRVFRVMRHMSDEAIWLAGGVVSLAAALAGLFWLALLHFGQRIGIKALRRLAR